jgi:integrase
MATVSFFIRTQKKNKLVPVKARLSDGKHSINLFAQTKEQVFPEHWSANDKKKGSKKSRTGFVRNLADANYKESVNKQLSSIKVHVLKEYLNYKGEPGKDWLQETIDFYYDPNAAKKGKTTLNGYIDNRVENLRKNYKGLTIATKNALQAYAESKQLKEIDFKHISSIRDFRNSFVNYLFEKKYRVNTIRNYLNIIKIVVRRANWDGYAPDEVVKVVNHPDFKLLAEEPETVYLTIDELKKIESAELPVKYKTYETTRDLFLIGCWTGQRISDYPQISTSNIKVKPNGKKYIEFTQQKTKSKLVIPLHPTVERILEKYNGKLPKASALNHYNDRIREICRIAGINDQVQEKIKIGNDLEITTTKKKWELVASHSARRSFASNMYHHYNMPTITIMAVTGHKSEKSFLKYLRVTPDEHATIMHNMWDEVDNRANMKVVNE